MSFEFNCVIEGHDTSGKGESVVSGDTIGNKMDMATTDAKELPAKMPAQRGH